MKKVKGNFSMLLAILMFVTMSFPVAAEETAKETEMTKLTEATKAEEAKMETLTEATVVKESNIIDIITINDFHGNVRESGKNIGMAKMVGYVNDAKAKNPHTIAVSAGDNYQGSAISNLTYGAPVNDMFKGMDLVASAVGNHEFDWGVDRIGKWGEEGGFPYVAANIYDKNTNKPVSWAKPYVIEEVNGVKIAFIGLATLQTAYQTALENVKDLEFKPAEVAAKTWVEHLKAGKDEAGVPDVIIALTHVPSYQNDGVVSGDELEPLTKVEGIDAIITGHSHKTVSGTLNDVPVIQAYKYGRSVGKVSIELNEDKSVKGITTSVDPVYKVSSDLIADADTTAIYDKYEADFEPIASKVVGEIKGELSHDRTQPNVTVLGYWASDIMRKATKAQIGLTNGGGLRRTLAEGKVTMGDMYEVMPFDNTLVTMTVTGEVLTALVEHGIEADFMTDGQFAGVEVVYDADALYGERIVSIALEDGTPIEATKEYTLVTNDFIAGGGDKYDFSKATNVVNTYIPIRDVLVKEFEGNSPVVAPEVDVIHTSATYTIMANDFLWKIAAKYNMTYQELAAMNGIKNPHLIFEGDTLIVPSK